MTTDKKIMVALVAVLVLGAVGFVAWQWSRPEEGPEVLEASGTVEATDALIGFEIPGTVASVAVDEGDALAAGAEIARLRTEQLEAHRAQAEAGITAARARLRELESGSRRQEIAQVEAEVTGARETLEEKRRELERTETLFEGGAVGRETFDRARTAAEVAASQLAQSEERLALVREGPRREKIEVQRAVVDEAKTARRAVDVQLAESILAAPFPGRVTARHKEPGEVVSPGAPVVTLQDPDDRWVRIYVPEDRLGAVHLGDEATILSDTYPDKRYTGRVSYIASEAEFTPKNVQTREERVRLVYAVKVRVTDDPGQELKAGMPVDVEIALDRDEEGRDAPDGEGASRR